MKPFTLTSLLLVPFAAVVLVGCGGSSNYSPSSEAESSSITLSGRVLNSTDASVCVVAIAAVDTCVSSEVNADENGDYVLNMQENQNDTLLVRSVSQDGYVVYAPLDNASENNSVNISPLTSAVVAEMLRNSVSKEEAAATVATWLELDANTLFDDYIAQEEVRAVALAAAIESVVDVTAFETQRMLEDIPQQESHVVLSVYKTLDAPTLYKLSKGTFESEDFAIEQYGLYLEEANIVVDGQSVTVRGFKEWFKNWDNVKKKIEVVVSGIAAAVVPVIAIVDKSIETISNVKNVIEDVKTGDQESLKEDVQETVADAKTIIEHIKTTVDIIKDTVKEFNDVRSYALLAQAA